jgi:hypothetical protein
MARCFDPSHRSYSGDRLWNECQWKANALTVNGVKPQMGEAAMVGKAVDAAVCLLIAGEAASVEREVEAAVHEEDPQAQRVWALDAMKEKASALVELWQRDVQPQMPEVFGTQVELHWEFEGATYHAHPDIILADGSVIDLKTSERRLEERRADHDFQLTYYAWGLYEVYGSLPPMVGLDGLIYANPPKDVLAWNPKATKPWYDSQRSRRLTAAVEAFRIEAAKRERSRNVARELDMHLTQGFTAQFACNGCAAKVDCPAWRGIQE